MLASYQDFFCVNHLRANVLGSAFALHVKLNTSRRAGGAVGESALTLDSYGL